MLPHHRADIGFTVQPGFDMIFRDSECLGHLELVLMLIYAASSQGPEGQRAFLLAVRQRARAMGININFNGWPDKSSAELAG